MSENNYKLKYEELKLKFVDSMDMAFRLGYEQGAKEAQLEQLMQAQAMQAQAMQNQATQEDAQQAEQEPEVAEVHENGSELDHHIAELESLINKSEVSPQDLKKTLEGLKTFSKVKKENNELKRSEKAVKALAKHMELGKQAKVNLNVQQKNALTLQHKIVNDIMKSWEDQEKKAEKDITNTLAIEGLLKK